MQTRLICPSKSGHDGALTSCPKTVLLGRPVKLTRRGVQSAMNFVFCVTARWRGTVEQSKEAGAASKWSARGSGQILALIQQCTCVREV
jgi:hypothetical protein